MPPREKIEEAIDLLSELQSGLQIDKFALEDVCQQHPELFYRVAEAYALAVSRRDEAAQDLKEEEASADARIRHDLEVEGEKVTEKAVESRRALDTKVLKARDRVLETTREVGRWGALKEAYSSRGYVLRDLVQLHLARYYSQASAEGSARRESDATVAEARRHISERAAARRQK